MNIQIPLQEKAYQYLKKQILTGRFEYDKIYSEAKIASSINISRTPVRDALVRLREERYINTIPNKGFCLHKMSKQDVIDTFQMRCAIEGFCAAQLARQIETQEGRNALSELKKALIVVENAIKRNDSVESIIEYDVVFHRLLVNYSQNDEFIKIMESYNHRLSTIAQDSFKSQGRPPKVREEHSNIINSIKRGDPFAAYEAVIIHMEASRDVVISDYVEEWKEF